MLDVLQTWLHGVVQGARHAHESGRIGNLVLAAWDAIAFAFNDEPGLCELTRFEEHIMIVA